MHRQPLITKSKLMEDLRSLGIAPGQTVMLHASVRSVGWIVGGPDVILQAILDVLTPTGTLLIYCSWDEWERALVDDVDNLPEEARRAYLDECPAFDPNISRAHQQWSILTEYVRTWPGARRSNHPTASVAAVGAQAAWITQDHPLAYGYGIGSPFAKLCQTGGKVLLLGAPPNSLTLLHHAEHLAELPHKRVVRNKTPILRDGARIWVEFEEFDTCDGIVSDHTAEEYFMAIVQEFLAAGEGRQHKIGAADSYLFDAATLVAFAKMWMEQRWNR
jgi:aminoglycoside 3-N-acetyltransferase